MSDLQTMVRMEISVDGNKYLLAQNQDTDDLKRRIESAVRAAGQFVEFVVVGNRAVSVLMTPMTTVALSVETVQFDPRDTGDEDVPYGGLFDY